MDRSIEIISMDFHQVYWVTGICDPSKSREQHHCSLKLGSNPPVVTGICDLYKSWARHHLSFKLGLKLKCLKINDVRTSSIYTDVVRSSAFWKKSYLFDLKPFIQISKNVQAPKFYMNDFQIKKLCWNIQTLHELRK